MLSKIQKFNLRKDSAHIIETQNTDAVSFIQTVSCETSDKLPDERPNSIGG